MQHWHRDEELCCLWRSNCPPWGGGGLWKSLVNCILPMWTLHCIVNSHYNVVSFPGSCAWVDNHQELEMRLFQWYSSILMYLHTSCYSCISTSRWFKLGPTLKFQSSIMVRFLHAWLHSFTYQIHPSYWPITWLFWQMVETVKKLSLQLQNGYMHDSEGLSNIPILSHFLEPESGITHTYYLLSPV